VTRAWLLLLALPSLAAAAPSEVIFPPQRLPLAFSHARHLQHKIACDFCHEKAPGSHSAADNLIPNEETCATCHPIDREHPERVSKSATACATCHPGWQPGRAVEPVAVPAPNLHFDHAAHVGRGVACTQCHGDLSGVGLATRAQLPQMTTCLGCHNGRRGKLDAPARCATCHLLQPDGTLQQQFPTGTLRPTGALRGDAHTLEFRTHHAQVAREDEKYCANCHRPIFCLDCHNGVTKPLDFHGNDYLSRHPIEARRNDPDCGSCHRRQSFCLGCHERLGVVDARTGVDSAFTPAGTRRFHPDGWADPTATHQPNHHAWQAQRNLRQCVACHRQETCLECHAAQPTVPGVPTAPGARGKQWVSPHPPGWSGSQRCLALADRNRRMCLRCHDATDLHLGCR
jgi:hypothetical protein